jgi:hypothetical protein
MYILMYYMPKRIFLCKFKYFAQSRTLARGGCGEKKVTAMFYEPQVRTVLLMTATGVQRD